MIGSPAITRHGIAWSELEAPSAATWLEPELDQNQIMRINNGVGLMRFRLHTIEPIHDLEAR